MLTAQTIGAFQEQIPYDALPRNFRDAIVITRQLGIPYLWIDSLCILQDSAEDWVRESKQMGMVYSHATVTLFAMMPRNSAEGILKAPSSSCEYLDPVTLCVDQNDLSRGEVSISGNVSVPEDFRRLNSPLVGRGWTLQEAFLSPRHLYYGQTQIYWSCSDGFQSADGLPEGNLFPDGATEGAFEKVLDTLNTASERLSHKSADDIEIILQEYYQIVKQYSGRALSFDSDKFPAFSGIVERFHRVLGGSYVAGLWSRDLARGLLWYADLETCKHMDVYRAPSWSWAVTNDPVLYHYDPPKPSTLSLQIIDYTVDLVDRNNTYGAIEFASVTVRGLTLPLVRSSQVISAKHHDAEESTMGYLHYDERGNDGVRGSCIMMPYCDEKEQDYSLRSYISTHEDVPDWKPDPGLFHSTTYTALIVQIDDDGTYCKSGIPGLILQSVGSESEGTFERVGVFEMNAGYNVDWFRNAWVARTLVLI